MAIDHIHLAGLDLNLLVALDALLTERSVTRAAHAVGVTQSAMSHSLARLRTLFGDEILTRAPEGMRPTPRALQLYDPLREVLSAIQSLTQKPEDFDPMTAEMTFTLGVPDSTEVILIPHLMLRLQKEAPKVRLLLANVDRYRVLDDLDAGRIDLAIGIFEQGQTHHKRRLLYPTNYLCLFNQELVGIEPPISLEDYVRLPHMLTSLIESQHGPVDVALEKLGLKRHIALTSPRFSATPFILKRAPLIATMHARLARLFSRKLGLAISPAPVELPDVRISMLWHSSNDNAPAQKWLRDTIYSLRHQVGRPG